VLLGALRLQRGLGPEAIAALFSGERFAPAPLSEAERDRLSAGSLDGAPPATAADFPDWIASSLARAFGADLVPELRALATRAPLDLRVNRLKASRTDALAAIQHLGATPTPHSPAGLRIAPSEDGRGPAIQAEPAFLKGLIEIQDEGSQLAALLSGARPGEQVADLCAGGGGKTLALSALMENHGQIYATDGDARRLAPIHERLARAGARNVQVRTPRGGAEAIGDLDGRIDLVLVDAPCTGTGTWRRNPDAKWRLRPGSLEARRKEQAAVLDRAARLAKPGGRISYVTCSVLPEENDDAVADLLGRHTGLATVPAEQVMAAAGLAALPVRPMQHGLQMTPLRTGTDAFYVALLRKG
jgi:16S rRNA (cytosine967-C5)-methyltransferase